MPDNVLLTTSQAAQALGVSASTVCRWSALGAPCEQTIGGHRRWDIDELREWVHLQVISCERECADEDDLEDDDLESSSDDDSSDDDENDADADEDDADDADIDDADDLDDDECDGCAEGCDECDPDDEEE